MNKIILSGRITRDIELRTTQSNKSVLDMSLAVQRDFKNKEGNYDADFINCSLWDKTAELVATYCKKGDKILVEGVIRNDQYQDNEGNNKYKTYVLVNKVEFLQTKKETTELDEVEKEDYSSNFDTTKVDDLELPF